jgi:hypothetical protein
MSPPKRTNNYTDQKEAADRGWHYLEYNHQDGHFPSSIGTSRTMENIKASPREIFSTLVVADTILKDNPEEEITRFIFQYLERQKGKNGLFTFFEDGAIYPPDTDTNALGCSILLENERITKQDAHAILDTILRYRDENELIQVWLSKNRSNRTDVVVCANALYLAYLLGRQEETKETENRLIQALDSNEYLEGTRYYESPDSFLYFISKLIKFPEFSNKLKTKLTIHLQKRIGTTSFPLDIAMRIIISDILEIPNESEKQKLLYLQEQDGSWSIDSLFHYGGKEGYFGNRAITTAFAIKALNS